MTAAAWTLLYVASKVHLATRGELGVTGGPAVTPADYAPYGPGEVAAAQWGNAGVGLLAVLLLLAPLLPAAGRAHRWVLLGPLVALALLTAGLAVGMLVGAVVGDRGGWPFGLFCVAWSALVVAVAAGYRRLRRAPRPAAAGRR